MKIDNHVMMQARNKVIQLLGSTHHAKFSQAVPTFVEIATMCASIYNPERKHFGKKSARRYILQMAGMEAAAKRNPPKCRVQPRLQKKPPRRRKYDTFLASWEWSELRYEALQRYGRRCQCCGALASIIPIHRCLVCGHMTDALMEANRAKQQASTLQVCCCGCQEYVEPQRYGKNVRFRRGHHMKLERQRIRARRRVYQRRKISHSKTWPPGLPTP